MKYVMPYAPFDFPFDKLRIRSGQAVSVFVRAEPFDQLRINYTRRVNRSMNDRQYK
jgi:hypothetical protein